VIEADGSQRSANDSSYLVKMNPHPQTQAASLNNFAESGTRHTVDLISKDVTQTVEDVTHGSHKDAINTINNVNEVEVDRLSGSLRNYVPVDAPTMEKSINTVNNSIVTQHL